MIQQMIESKQIRRPRVKKIVQTVEYKESQQDREEEEVNMIMKIQQQKQREQRQMIEENRQASEQRAKLHSAKPNMIVGINEYEDESQLKKEVKGNALQQHLHKEMKRGHVGKRDSVQLKQIGSQKALPTTGADYHALNAHSGGGELQEDDELNGFQEMPQLT